MTEIFGLVVVAFFAGTAVIGRSCFLWGRYEGFIQGKAARSFWDTLGFNTEAIDFDKKVDIVCNACGLVGEFECAACNPVECGVCGKADCDWGASVAAFLAGKA